MATSKRSSPADRPWLRRRPCATAGLPPPARTMRMPTFFPEAAAAGVPAADRAPLRCPRRGAAGPRPTRPRRGGARPDAVRMDTVKVDTRKLDNLVDMVGELVIVQSMIQEDPALGGVANERLTRNLGQLKRITTDLQRNAMAMRMVPVQQTFQKMARLVRDLGRKSGKIGRTRTGRRGHGTRPPGRRGHQRPADAHGPQQHGPRHRRRRRRVPAPASRRTAGSSLSAFHQGGSIVIAVSDDGGGLNTEKIRRKAIAQGLITDDQVLSDNEIHQLIFRAGFSTADKVTEISGRGVGMDVVRRNIEALRGRVEIQSVSGKGTTFLIKLPLTLAILEGLVIRTAGRRFVLPTFAVSESLRPKPEQVHDVQGRPADDPGAQFAAAARVAGRVARHRRGARAAVRAHRRRHRRQRPHARACWWMNWSASRKSSSSRSGRRSPRCGALPAARSWATGASG